MRQARDGFERENRHNNIPLDAPERNYKDASHKPECLCAVTRFEGMKGFRAPKDILKLMDQVFRKTPFKELDPLRKDSNSDGLKRFFTSLMIMDEARQAQVVNDAVEGAKRIAGEDRAFHWLLELNREYPGDGGVLSPLYLNLVDLSPGDAIYVPAGELHAYLSGVGMEIMASSDNVLRGGLTPKHIDIPELLGVVNFTATPVLTQRPLADGNFERIYETPAAEFQLSEIVLNGDERFISRKERSVEILICMAGQGLIEELESGQSLLLKKGMSIIIPSAVPGYALSGSMTLYKGGVGTVVKKG
jgi:mannose-6-phosphate isomerase